MSEEKIQEKKDSGKKHVIPLNLTADSLKSTQKATPLSACDCDDNCTVDICGVYG